MNLLQLLYCYWISNPLMRCLKLKKIGFLVTPVLKFGMMENGFLICFSNALLEIGCTQQFSSFFSLNIMFKFFDDIPRCIKTEILILLSVFFFFSQLEKKMLLTDSTLSLLDYSFITGAFWCYNPVFSVRLFVFQAHPYFHQVRSAEISRMRTQ